MIIKQWRKGGEKGSRANVYKCIIQQKPLPLEPKQNVDNSFETFLNVVISRFLKFRSPTKYDQKHIKKFYQRKSPS